MRTMWIAVVAAAVAGACARQRDVDELRAELRAEITKIEARTVAVERMFAVDEFPIADYDKTPTKWWCNTVAGACYRSRADCDAAEAAEVARTQYADRPHVRKDCTSRRIAFCQSRCFTKLSTCLVMGDGTGCVGVE